MWQDWTIIQAEKLNQDLDIYIGCMTGTSADSTADFTAVAFDEDGLPICFKNCPIRIPEALGDTLLKLSKSDRAKTLRCDGSQAESQLTKFLAAAFLKVIKKIGLENYAKEKIILSPHGQALDHKPNDIDFYTDIIINGPILAQQTGYKTVTQHRQAPLAVSMAAPLAPVLIKKLFADGDKNVVLINGGGIANIAVLLKHNPEMIIGFDTGPANGPIDALVQYMVNNNLLDDVPIGLRDIIEKNKFDVDGQLAQEGSIITSLYEELSKHEFFKRSYQQKSADRAEFGLERWVFPSIEKLKLDNYCWADIITTVSAVIADSVANAVLNALPKTKLVEPTRIIHYGGMNYNQYLMDRIEDNLQKNGTFEFVDMQLLGYEPDFFESLLMAYLGYCAHQHIAINLAYCARSKDINPYAIPGVVAYPVT